MTSIIRYCWPVVEGTTSQKFGEHPDWYRRFNEAGHTGLDIACPVGTPVWAFADGEVEAAGFDSDYGKYVKILHRQLEVYTLYGHQSWLRVGVDDQVVAGQVIGESGQTGNVTGPHLHFEVRIVRGTISRVPEPGFQEGQLDPLKFVSSLG